MTASGGFRCGRCGEWHDELPFAFHAEAPAYWSCELADDGASELGEDHCIVRGEHFFVRGLVQLPVVDADEAFDWGVWVSLSEQSFQRVIDGGNRPGRESDPPMFGWLSTELPVYSPPTLGLKAMVHTRGVGLRPTIELEPTDHPLAVDQRAGISVARVQELAEHFRHAP